MILKRPNFHVLFFLFNCTRLRKLASLLFSELGFGDQLGHSLVVMRLLWVWFYSLQLHSWPGFLLFLNSRPVCSLTKHLVEGYRFLVFLAATGRIVHHATRSNLTVIKTIAYAYSSTISLYMVYFFITIISCCDYWSNWAGITSIFCFPFDWSPEAFSWSDLLNLVWNDFLSKNETDI